jgi:hypothetical protein
MKAIIPYLWQIAIALVAFAYHLVKVNALKTKIPPPASTIGALGTSTTGLQAALADVGSKLTAKDDLTSLLAALTPLVPQLRGHQTLALTVAEGLDAVATAVEAAHSKASTPAGGGTGAGVSLPPAAPVVGG